MSPRLVTTFAALLEGAGSTLRIFGGRGAEALALCPVDDAAAFAEDCATLRRDYLEAPWNMPSRTQGTGTLRRDLNSLGIDG
jgi:hypothetical protein